MSGAFWRFGNDYQSLSTINKLLDDISNEAKEIDIQPGVEAQDEVLQSPIATLEQDQDIKVLDQLLDQQDILQDLLSSNTRLLDFLKNFKVLNKLVELVILDFNEYNQLKKKQLKRREALQQKQSSSENDDKKDNESDKKEYSEKKKDEGKDDDDDETMKEKPDIKNDDDDDDKALSESESTSSSSDSEGNTPIKSDSSWDDGNNSLSSFYDSNSFYNLNGNNDDEGEEDENPQEIYSRRSQVAAEILSSDIWSITDSFINYPRLLMKLWSVLDSKQPLSMMKSGFFSKINEHLLDMKLDELISYIINYEKDLANRFLNHINNPQLMDFLLKLISTDKSNNSTGIILVLKKQKFIPKLINFLKPKYDNAVQTSAGDFLKAFITISGNSASGQDGSGITDNSIIGPNELTRQLVSKKMVKKLVKIMLAGGNSLSNGVGIVIEIIRKNNSDYDVFQLMLITVESHPPNLRDPIYLGNLVKIFAKNIKHFKRMLLYGSAQHPLKNHKKGKVETSFQKKVEPLGFERFKICELVAELLHCSNMALLNEATGEEVVKERDLERVKVLKAELEQLEESKQSYLEDLKLNGDEALAEYIQSSSNPIVRNVTIEESDDEEGGVASKAGEQDSHEIVHNINRLSINDESKHAESIESIRSEHNRNKRAKIDKVKSKDGVIQSESDESDLDDAENSNGNSKSALSDNSSDDGDDDDDDDYEHEYDDDKDDDRDEEDTDSLYEIDLSGEINEEGGEAYEKALESKIESDEFTFDFGGLLQKHSYKDEFHIKGRQYYDADEKSIREKFIVGDQLKIALQDSNIVMIIIDFFFKFPWNNFLHNVVYDIIQQILNGSIEVGFNKFLIINLFLKQKGFILEKILRGYEFSEKYEKINNGLRLGHMGHLTLISEEVVKFLSFSNLKSLFGEPVEGQEDVEREYEFVNNGEEWNNYVSNILIDTREQFNSVLGGGSLNDDYEVVNESHDNSGNDDEGDDDDVDDDADDDNNDDSNNNGNNNNNSSHDDDDDDDDNDEGVENGSGNTSGGSENLNDNSFEYDDVEEESYGKEHAEYLDDAEHDAQSENNKERDNGTEVEKDGSENGSFYHVKNKAGQQLSLNDNKENEQEVKPHDLGEGSGDQFNKWHYLDRSDYNSDASKSSSTSTARHHHHLEQGDEDEDEYIDPNDDGNNYANDKNVYPYGTASSEHLNGDLIDEDEDDDDVDIDEDEESYGLSRSKSKGDMNWNEDEQKRLLTMANYIHNNTGGSAYQN